MQKPVDQYWNTPAGDLVIKASLIDPSDESLASCQRTDDYVQNYLKVIEPKILDGKRCVRVHGENA